MKKKYPIRAIKDIGKKTSDGVCVYSLDDKTFTYFNKGFLKILHTSEEEISENHHKVIDRLIKDDWEYASLHFANIRNKGKIKNVEFRLKFGSIEKFISLDAFLLNNGSLVATIIKDVTMAKHHTNYIVEFGARKDALLDMVAHNLSGPLNLTNSLLNAIDQLNKNQQFKKIDDYSRLIRESTQQCIEIINSFLNEEHSESERIFATHNLFEVNAKVKIVVERLKQFNKDKEFKIVSNKPEIMVSSDDVKFFQIIHNLLSNAVKFTAGKGKITVIINDHEDFFEVSVADNGIGIPDYLHPYIFQRNTPASREGLKGEKSIGMGLYIVKKLADMLRGTVSFQSQENPGSTFVVRLPKE